MIKYFTGFLFCFLVLTGMGQKANYKQAEKFMGSKVSSLVKSTSVSPRYFKDSDRFWYEYRTGDGLRYYFVDPKAKIHRELFNREYVAGEISKVTGKPMNGKDLKLNGVSWNEDGNGLEIKVENLRFEYDLQTNRLVKMDSVKKKAPEKKKVSKKEETPIKKQRKKVTGTYSPDETYVVYAKNHNLYLLSVADSVETQLTTDGAPGYSYVDTDRGSGLNILIGGRDSTKASRASVTWFSDSEHFVVKRSDKRKVKGTLPVVNHLGKQLTVKFSEYLIPGEEFLPQEELFLFDTLNKKQVRLPIDKWKDQSVKLYPTKDKSRIYFLRKKRTCDEVDFCRIEPKTGEVKLVINEVSKPYFSNEFFNISLLNEGDDIIWWSERTGYGHFYRYDADGNLKNVITSGEWTAGRILKTDTLGRVIYFGAYGQQKGESPYYVRVNKVGIDGKGKVEVLTPEQATHRVEFSKSGRYFVDNYSRADLEPRSVVRDLRGKVVLELASPDLKSLYASGWKKPEAFTVKAADGITDLYGFMWKPFDFDSTKRYPIISYVYPGPQTEAIPLEFEATGIFNVALAQVGFVVVTFGHRGGSPLRERWYHTYGHGDLRDYPLADDKCGIEQLADRFSFIDRSKVGIFGHSGGGFMSTAALCTYPDFYTAAVSSSGNHDNNIYNKWWGETHHGIKEIKSVEKKKVKDTITGKDTTLVQEKVRFESTIPTNMELAKNLKGHLLLVTGDMDDNVHPAHTIRMADALLKAGKNFDLVVLPGQGHRYAGVQLDFYQRKMWFHFAKHLLGDFSAESFSEMDEYMELKMKN